MECIFNLDTTNGGDIRRECASLRFLKCDKMDNQVLGCYSKVNEVGFGRSDQKRKNARK